MVGTESDAGGIDAIRKTLDALAGKYLHSFYYVPSMVPSNNPGAVGLFPPSADLDAAHAMSRSPRNPTQPIPAANPLLLSFGAAPSKGDLAGPTPRPPTPMRAGTKRRTRKRIHEPRNCSCNGDCLLRGRRIGAEQFVPKLRAWSLCLLQRALVPRTPDLLEDNARANKLLISGRK
jgi:hypothetical protein